MRIPAILFFFLAVLSSIAQTGPGGVGSSSTNQLWLRANTGVFTDAGSTSASNGNNIQQWNDQSGNTRNAVQLTAGNQPNYQTGVMNGFPVIRFTNANGDRILSSGLTTGNAASVWVVASYTSLPSPNPGLVQAAPSGLGFSTGGADKVIGMWVSSTSPFRVWGRGVQTDNTQVNLSNSTGTPTAAGTVYLYANQYNGTNTVSQYVSGTVSSTVAYNGTLRSWTDFAIGSQGGEGWNGDIAEVIAYNTFVNSAQRIIIDNYLAAKYGLTGVSNIANDFYTMDDVTNGNFDYDVAGIGRVNSTNFHTDAQGTGFLRILNPTDLQDGEYFMFGHNNLAAVASNTDVPAGLTGRFDRVWRVSETGEVGNLDLQFDLSGLPDFTSLSTCDAASSIRLLVDTDNDGVFSDQTPITGATNIGGNIYRFANMGPINNNYRFTIGLVSSGITGPGGVGGTNGTTSLKLWMDAGKGVTATAGLVSTWLDQSGNSNIASQVTSTNQPTLVSTALNTQPVINFSASNKSLHLSTNINTTTPTAFFVANKPAAGTTYMAMLTLQQNTWLAQGTGVDQWGMRLTPDALSGVQLTSTYRIMTTLERNFNDVDFYTDESAVVNRTTGTAYLGKALGTIGSNSAGTIGSEIENFNGNIAEIIVYNTVLNSAQRIIVDNYLAAKYGLPLTSNDIYTGDNTGYDFEAAGIGRVNATNFHSDAKGAGLVRVSNPSSLDDGDFFMWGHNNLSIIGSIADVPATVDARWSREWLVTETGEVGNIDMQFDLSGQGSVTASDLRLLIDHDGDGVFNEGGTIVISGAAALSCNNYLFTGVPSINTGMGFTIGTINRFQTPLPITLVSFNGRMNEGVTELSWSTATEHNNDYFTVERSEDGERFNPITTVPGAGQSVITRNYSATDNFPPNGKIYYRLKQTDFDKDFTYSKIIVVENPYAEPQILVSPNPVRIGAELNVKILHSKNYNEVGFVLYDMLGKSITTTYEQNGNSFKIKTANVKAAGFYILKAYSTDFNSYQRIYLTE